MDSISILYENDEILIINKREGVSVQGGVNISHSLDEDLSKQLGYKIYLVHRLDKETSGLMIVAKSPKSAAKWTDLIGRKEVKKEYCAVCFSVPVINGKKRLKGSLQDKVSVHGKDLNACLDYDVVKTEPLAVNTEEGEKNEEISLIHIVLGTGRMHQIRIQLARAGSPLVADDKHGNFKLNKLVRKAGMKKMCLCAFRLSVPLEGKIKVFEIPLPSYFPI